MAGRLGILEWGLAVVMTALVGLVFTQVLVRYLTYQPLGWTEEAARYTFIWLCLLGAVVAARRGQHFAVDLVRRSLPATAQRVVTTGIHGIEAAFYMLFVFAGIEVLAIVRLQQSPSLEISMGIPYLAIPLGSALLSIIAAQQAWAAWSNQEN